MKQISQNVLCKETEDLVDGGIEQFFRPCHLSLLVERSRAGFDNNKGKVLAGGSSRYGLPGDVIAHAPEKSLGCCCRGASHRRTMTRPLNAPHCPPTPPLTLLPLALTQTPAATFESKFQIQDQIHFEIHIQIPFNWDDPNTGYSQWSLTSLAKLAILLQYAQCTYLPSKGIWGWKLWFGWLERSNPEVRWYRNLESPLCPNNNKTFVSAKLHLSQTLQEFQKLLLIEYWFWLPWFAILTFLRF